MPEPAEGTLSPPHDTGRQYGAALPVHHFGPSHPLHTSPWLLLALSQALGRGARAVVLPRGARLRALPRVLRGVQGTLHKRCLPKGLVTAYPRKSNYFEDPETGLASIEALHAAVAMLGQRDDRLLEGYYWAEQYLERNADLLAPAT